MTWAMVAFAVIAAGCQALAHVLVHARANRIERYVIGTGIIGVCFSVGWLLDERQHPVVGLWSVIIASFIAVWACYRVRERQEERSSTIASYLEREFSDD